MLWKLKMLTLSWGIVHQAEGNSEKKKKAEKRLHCCVDISRLLRLPYKGSRRRDSPPWRKKEKRTRTWPEWHWKPKEQWSKSANWPTRGDGQADKKKKHLGSYEESDVMPFSRKIADRRTKFGGYIWNWSATLLGSRSISILPSSDG